MQLSKSAKELSNQLYNSAWNSLSKQWQFWGKGFLFQMLQRETFCKIIPVCILGSSTRWHAILARREKPGICPDCVALSIKCCTIKCLLKQWDWERLHKWSEMYESLQVSQLSDSKINLVLVFI